MDLIDSLQGRVWIPHQAGLEFFRNRLNVIAQESDKYRPAIQSMERLLSEFEGSLRHPFLSEKVFSELRAVFKIAQKELLDRKEENDRRKEQCDILRWMTERFKNSMGEPFNEKVASDLSSKGQIRYDNKVPPGFEDAKKPVDRRFGDLFVWKQILHHSKESEKGIIFVTSDNKEDWWQIEGRKTLGPRVELKAEFNREGHGCFQMYQTRRFLKFANQYLNSKVSKEVVREVEEAERRTRKDSDFSRHPITNTGDSKSLTPGSIRNEEAMRPSWYNRSAIEEYRIAKEREEARRTTWANSGTSEEAYRLAMERAEAIRSTRASSTAEEAYRIAMEREDALRSVWAGGYTAEEAYLSALEREESIRSTWNSSGAVEHADRLAWEREKAIMSSRDSSASLEALRHSASEASTNNYTEE